MTFADLDTSWESSGFSGALLGVPKRRRQVCSYSTPQLILGLSRSVSAGASETAADPGKRLMFRFGGCRRQALDQQQLSLRLPPL